MRWVVFIVLAYAMAVFQTSLVPLITFTLSSVGTIAPDSLAIVAIFVAMNVRYGLDVMLAAWILGMTADLTTGGAGLAIPVIGPMAIAYALAAGAVFRFREVFVPEWTASKIILAIVFCLVAHEIGRAHV
jgi:hypothetical protein